MSRTSKRVLFAVGGVAGVAILVALGVLLSLGANAKRHVQALTSDALGMEVFVGGQLAVALFPSLHVTMEDVQIRNRGAELAAAKQASVGLELLPLLRKEVRLTRIGLQHVQISIQRRRDGGYTFETGADPARRIAAARVAQVTLADATLHYTDERSGHGFEAGPCDLDARDLQLSNEDGAPGLRRVSVAATLACGEVRTTDLVASEVKVSIAGKEGVFDLNPVTMHVFGGQGSGHVKMDLSGSVPGYLVHYVLSKFNLAQFFRTLSPKNVGAGTMDFAAEVSMKGTTVDEAIRSAGGKASLRGHDLTLQIGDIDEKFARYEASQSFNLVDIGALFFAGPLGLVATKGFNFANLLQSPGGSSHIRALVSDWTIEHGVAYARDVAMATQQNRVALKGELDFVNWRFKDVTVVLVDAQGCARVRQKVSGPFAKPEVEKPDVLTSLAGPVRNLLRQAKTLLGGQCDVFYAGSVTPPQ